MKDFLRKCYQKAGITGANAQLYENRLTVIQSILNSEDPFTSEEWMLLAKWAIGAVSEDEAEKQRIDLEEAFCKTDPGYSNENEEELHILVGLLLYLYCKKTENLILPSIVVCGQGVGWRLRCQLIYGKFLALTNEARLDLRRLDQRVFPDTFDMAGSLRSLKAEIEAEAEETAKKTAKKTADPNTAALSNELEKAKEQLCTLSRQNRALAFTLSVQREESDILWWTLSEWSETCQRSYRSMARHEAAVFSAYELSNIVNLPLGPYASKQILMKMISLSKTEGQERASAAEWIQRLNGDFLPPFDEKCRIKELQPVLSALSAKRKAAKKGKASEWQRYYETTCEKDLNTLMLTAFELGLQIYLEIELGRQLYLEGNGE